MRDFARFESYLNCHLLGQAEAIREFTGVVLRAETGPARPGRLKGFVLLLGPTGTGKTELVKQTARFLYGDGGTEGRLARFDMGNFQHADSVQHLLGGVAGQPALLGNAIDSLNAQGGGILLFDEIEKGHPDIMSVLLALDDARVQLADGRVLDVSRCYVVLTSNIGAAEAAQMVTSSYAAIRRKVIHDAEEKLRKETVARFSAVCVFNRLSFEIQEQIVRELLQKEINLHSLHLGRLLVLGEGVIPFLIRRGFSADMGARNIRRAVEQAIGNAVQPYMLKPEAGPSTDPTRMAYLFDHALVLMVEGDELGAWPMRHSPAMERIRQREMGLAVA